jgi:hypothetical protein
MSVIIDQLLDATAERPALELLNLNLCITHEIDILVLPGRLIQHRLFPQRSVLVLVLSLLFYHLHYPLPLLLLLLFQLLFLLLALHPSSQFCLNTLMPCFFQLLCTTILSYGSLMHLALQVQLHSGPLLVLRITLA